MRVLQFAKRPVLTVALLSAALAGCGDSGPEAPFNPSGTTADLAAMNSTFASPEFASFSTFSLMFDQALGGAPIIAQSAGAFGIGQSLSLAKRGDAGALRAAAARSAQRVTAMLKRQAREGFSPSLAAAAVPASVAGKTFVYDPGTFGYVMSDESGAPSNGVRFILYAVNPITYQPVEPLNAIGYADLIDMSEGSTQAARVRVVSGSTTYIDYTVSATTTTTSGRVSVSGMITDGTIQAKVNLRSTITYTAGLTLTYSLDLPEREVSIDLTVNSSDISQPTGSITINMLMTGPNGTIAMTGEFSETSGELQVRINGDAFATVTTNGTTTTITRVDGNPLADDEMQALEGVFQVQADAFISFDQMLTPIGAFFTEPA